MQQLKSLDIKTAIALFSAITVAGNVVVSLWSGAFEIGAKVERVQNSITVIDHRLTAKMEMYELRLQRLEAGRK